MLIPANTSAPCALPDFLTRKDFSREITAPVIGISSIIVSVAKVRERSRMIKAFIPVPGSTIIGLECHDAAKL